VEFTVGSKSMVVGVGVGGESGGVGSR
jgi:hypothetical protein